MPIGPGGHAKVLACCSRCCAARSRALECFLSCLASRSCALASVSCNRRGRARRLACTRQGKKYMCRIAWKHLCPPGDQEQGAIKWVFK